MIMNSSKVMNLLRAEWIFEEMRDEILVDWSDDVRAVRKRGKRWRGME